MGDSSDDDNGSGSKGLETPSENPGRVGRESAWP
jgi:hypothetical protein